jgi:hypothetical protein
MTASAKARLPQFFFAAMTYVNVSDSMHSGHARHFNVMPGIGGVWQTMLRFFFAGGRGKISSESDLS